VWQRADILFRTQRACMRKQEWLGRTGEAADSGRHHGRGLLMARDDEPYPPALAQAVHKVQVLLACRSARRAQQRRLLCCSQAAHSQPGAGRAPAVSRTGRNDEQRPRQPPPRCEPLAAEGGPRTRNTKDVVHVLVLQRPAHPAQASAPAALRFAGPAAEPGRGVLWQAAESLGKSERTV
jgi:hypothetical protein